jgi:hypothetical protein
VEGTLKVETAATNAPTGLFDALRESWHRAAERVGVVTTREFDVGGGPVRIHGAGTALLPSLTRALAHLPAGAGGEAGLDVLAWDDASTGTTTPVPPAPGTLAAGFRGRSGERFVWLEAGRLDALDTTRGEALVWLESPDRLPVLEVAAPLRSILARWAAGRGLRLLHAGAVGREDGCLLLVGRSGAGKSTTALSCLGSELGYLSDDYCLVRADEPMVYSLYSSAKMGTRTLALLPHLVPHAEHPGPPGEKALTYVAEHAPDSLLAAAPVRGVVLPRITDRRAPALVPAGRGAALMEMAPSSIDEDPHLREAAFRLLAELASSVPCHVLELGSDVAAVPPLLVRLLDAPPPEAGP